MSSEKVEEFASYFEKDSLESDLLRMEEAFKKNTDDKKDIVQHVFREVHSLKGTAGMLKITPLLYFLHAYEDALGVLSKNVHSVESVKDEALFDFFLSGLDLVDEILRALRENEDMLIKENPHLLSKFVDALLKGDHIIKNCEGYLQMASLDEDLF